MHLATASVNGVNRKHTITNAEISTITLKKKLKIIPTKPTHEPNPQTMICKKLLMNINKHSIKSLDQKFSQSDRTVG
jgi:hypothetical protein